MTSRLNVVRESKRFGDELTDLLNATVCTGVRLTSVPSEESHPRTVIGYGISRRAQDLRSGVPLTINSRAARLYLGLAFRLEADDEYRYLMVTSSAMVLSLDSDLEKVLLHYDYERSKRDGYPEAHLQVCASSGYWQECSRVDGSSRALERLHLPVGPRRFRPSLEDVIEFLISEKLVAARPGWERAVDRGRDAFQEGQLFGATLRPLCLCCERNTCSNREDWSAPLHPVHS